jgi:hypothetical protein
MAKKAVEIKGYSRYMLTRQGEIWSKKYDKIVANRTIGFDGDIYYYLYPDKGGPRKVALKVLVWLAHRNQHLNARVIERIDGDISNNHISNFRQIDIATAMKKERKKSLAVIPESKVSSSSKVNDISTEDIYYWLATDSLSKSYHFISNIYLYKGWECDFVRFKENGYLHEFEVKKSYHDFKNDFKKSRRRVGLKHNYIKKECCPVTTFNFVAPMGVIPIDELPEHCGLIEIESVGKTIQGSVAIKAPRLKANKLSDKQMSHINKKYRYAYQRELMKNLEISIDLS